MTVLAWVGLVVGAAMVLGTLGSVMATLVVPRGLRSRLAAAVQLVVTGLFHLLARHGDYEQRDRVLSFAGPTYLMSLLGVWVLSIYVGFALMFLPFTDASLGAALRASGSSMFTLGFAVPVGTGPTVLVFLAAALGLITVALQIAYLPTVYSAFNRRETLVTMLESRGGVPSWGPEILARHELIDNVSSLAGLYGQWEEWAADVAESHTTYQALILFRSPNPLRSWVTSLLSVLDAAALHLSLNPLTAPAQARPFMRMGYMSLREIAHALGIPFNPDPKPEDPVLLTRAEFDDALETMAAAGWRFEREPDEAWVQFRGWRVNYEQLAWDIADRVDAPPALWSGSRRDAATRAIAPARPPHRAPKDEQAEWKALTAARRLARPAELGLEPERAQENLAPQMLETRKDVGDG